MMINMVDLWRHIPEDILQQKSSEWSEKYNIMTFVTEILNSENPVTKSLIEEGKIFHIANVEAGDVVYVPSGMLLMEKVTGASPCVGVRMTVPDACSNIACENLQCMIGAFQKHISGESKLVQLWKKAVNIQVNIEAANSASK